VFVNTALHQKKKKNDKLLHFFGIGLFPATSVEKNRPTCDYFGICVAAGASAAGTAGAAGAGAAEAAAGAEPVVGIAPDPLDGATGAVTFSITPPPTVALRSLAMNDKASVAEKNTAAATPVDFDMKFDEPVAPNRLPDAPEPKAAPMSAPLPCCSNTSAMISNADKTCTTTTKLNNVFMPFPFSV
jgi:hypothetical protein